MNFERFAGRREVVKLGIAAVSAGLMRKESASAQTNEHSVTPGNISLFEKVDVQKLISETPNFTPVSVTSRAPELPDLITPGDEAISPVDLVLMQVAASEMERPDSGNILIHGIQVMCMGNEYSILGCDVQRNTVEYNPKIKFVPGSI
jgi:hypothetical protein